MPRIGQTSTDVAKTTAEPKRQGFKYGQDKFVCPVCGAVHWYPFKDGCHNDKCPYTGVLMMERKGE